jgi:hypothetical protein
MFLTIKPGPKEYIEMQLTQLHNILRILELPEDTICFFLGSALTDFVKKNPEAPDPFNIKSYLDNPQNDSYRGGQIQIFNMVSRGSDVLHVIKFMAACKSNSQRLNKTLAESFDHLSLYEKALNLSEMLKRTKKSEILNRADLSDESSEKVLSDLKKLLKNELNSAKEQIEILVSMPKEEVDWRTNPGSRIFLMEVAEDMFCDSAIKYNAQFTEDWENYPFDPEYFNSHVPDVLFPEFVRFVGQLLQPFSFFEQSRILNQSLAQFKAVTPNQRRQIIFAKYKRKYWAPNSVLTEPASSLDYLFQIFPFYEKYFSLFKDFTEQELTKLSSTHNTAQPVLLQPKASTQKPKLLSFQYKEHSKNPEAITELFRDLKDMGLIDSQTSIHEFKRVFLNGKPENPIKWTGTISELHFFIKCLHNQEKKVDYLKQRHWEVAQQCFVDSEGNRFEREKLKNQKDPVSADIIRKFIQNL